MNDNDRFFAGVLFDNKVLQADGQAFENLFTQLMGLLHPGFCKVKAYGNEGDRKNDGFIPGEQRYFQCYAPEVVQKSKAQLIKKLHEDFLGLLSYWQNESFEVRHFCFVVNDKNNGLSPDAYFELAKLKRSYPDIDMQFWLMPQLKNAFFKLTKPQMIEIVGCIPSDIGDLDYYALADVIKHILEYQKPISFDENLQDRKGFGEKIQLNGLSLRVASFLTTASYQINALDDFIVRHEKAAVQQIRDRFVNYYEEAKSQYPDDGIASADNRFIFIAKAAAPEEIGDANQAKKIQDAIFILMAYFFEACDIFETQ
jgi:hypothetical protein